MTEINNKQCVSLGHDHHVWIDGLRAGRDSMHLCLTLEEAEAQSPYLIEQLDAAEARIRDLTQEVRDERAAALDQIEQVAIRDARIEAVQDVLDRWEVSGYDALLRRIRRALEARLAPPRSHTSAPNCYQPRHPEADSIQELIEEYTGPGGPDFADFLASRGVRVEGSGR